MATRFTQLTDTFNSYNGINNLPCVVDSTEKKIIAKAPDGVTERFIDLLDAPAGTQYQEKYLVGQTDVERLQWADSDVHDHSRFELLIDTDINTNQALSNQYLKVDNNRIKNTTTVTSSKFIDLTDTPNSITESDIGKFLRVNPTGDAIIFDTATVDQEPTLFTELADVPNDLSILEGQSMVVKGTEDGLEASATLQVTTGSTTFAGLTDTVTPVGNDNKYLAYIGTNQVGWINLPTYPDKSYFNKTLLQNATSPTTLVLSKSNAFNGIWHNITAGSSGLYHSANGSPDTEDYTNLFGFRYPELTPKKFKVYWNITFEASNLSGNTVYLKFAKRGELQADTVTTFRQSSDNALFEGNKTYNASGTTVVELGGTVTPDGPDITAELAIMVPISSSDTKTSYNITPRCGNITIVEL